MRGTWRPPQPAAGRTIVDRLIAALSSSFSHDGADAIGPETVLIIDGGGRAPSVRTPVRGRAEVVGGLRDLMTEGTTPTLASINGSYGVTLVREGRVVGVITTESDGGMLSTIWVVCNPEKLRHWNAG